MEKENADIENYGIDESTLETIEPRSDKVEIPDTNKNDFDESRDIDESFDRIVKSISSQLGNSDSESCDNDQSTMKIMVSKSKEVGNLDIKSSDIDESTVRSIESRTYGVRNSDTGDCDLDESSDIDASSDIDESFERIIESVRNKSGNVDIESNNKVGNPDGENSDIDESVDGDKSSDVAVSSDIDESAARTSEMRHPDNETCDFDESIMSTSLSRNDNYNLKSCRVVLSRLDEKTVNHQKSDVMLINRQRLDPDAENCGSDESAMSTIAVRSDNYNLKSCSVVLSKLDEKNIKAHKHDMMKNHIPIRAGKKFADNYFELDMFETELSEGSENEDSWSVNEEICYSKQKVVQKFDCLCGQNFENLNQHFEHICKYKECSGYFCIACKKIMKRSSMFLKHKREHAGFKCVPCKMKFNFRTGYAYHRKIYHPESRLFPCSSCEKSFSRKRDLMLHTQSHKKYVCYICLKRFGLRRYYNVHVKNEH